MNKLEMYNYLKKINIWHEITEHKAVYNMAELAQIDIPYPNSEAKNLFVRDDKKRNYYLITIKGKRFDEYFKPILRGCHATWSIK